MRLPLLLALLAVLAGCGPTTGADRPDESATLLLDSKPNAVHAGIYLAVSRGFDEAEGVRLRILQPTASTDAATALQRGRADTAILPIGALARARDRGRDLVGVMAVVQRPLARAQRQLDYPGLVLAVTRATLEDKRSLVRATIRALQRGYAETQNDPESAVSSMLEREPGLDRAALAAQLDAVDPAFTAGAADFGELRPAALRAWAKSLKPPLDVSRAFDTTLVKRPPAQ